MAYRSIHTQLNLAHRGIILVARQRSVAAASLSSSSSSSSSRTNSNNSCAYRGGLFHNNNNNNNNNNSILQSPRRSYSSSVTVTASKEYAPNPLDAFRDPVDRATRMQETVGRQWSVQELRRKSYDDLHKLWYVLYKEKNMLLTEQQLSRRRQLIFPQPERFKKVQKSMGAIRQVLGERKRETVAAHLQRHQEKQDAKASEMMAELDREDVSYEEAEESGGGTENNTENVTAK